MTVAFTNEDLTKYAATVATITDEELMFSGTGPSVFERKLEIAALNIGSAVQNRLVSRSTSMLPNSIRCLRLSCPI